VLYRLHELVLACRCQNQDRLFKINDQA